jgi:cyclopropane fatty-acyl-phospholipid synthase-like methyltransferase
MDNAIKKDLIDSYQVDGGFIVHNAAMLDKLYKGLGIDPKVSLDRKVYELEGLTHFFAQDVMALVKKLGITKDDHVLSCGEGNGAPSRLMIKMTGCRVTGVDINPNQVAKARECAILHGVQDRATYIEANVEDFSLERKDFTKAFVNETCGHWQHKDKAFARIYAHLKEGAKIGFNAWTKGDKGSLNEAFEPIPEFRPLYKRGIWFQDDLATYQLLLEGAGFKVLEMYDCTDKLDIKMRARIKALPQWENYGRIMGKKEAESGLNYYKGMLKTHYDYLRYAVIIAQK